MNQVLRSVEPAVPLEQLLKDWPDISRRLSEPPRKRRAQIERYCACAAEENQEPKHVNAYGACPRINPSARRLGIFTLALLRSIHPALTRIPRQIDRLANHALIAAAADRMRTVTDSHVNRAADEVVL